MSLKAAFNLALKIGPRRNVTLSRPGGYSADVTVSPSNYSRKLEGPSDTVFKGREFILSKEEMLAKSVPTLRRGDRMVDAEMGTMVIEEIIEMFDIGGDIMGYRLRTD